MEQATATARAANIVTEVPGPKSQAVLARKDKVCPDAFSIAVPVVTDHAHGALLTDIDGNTFIDFAGGVGCLNVGHTNERVVAAMHAQIDRFTHTDFTVVPYENYVDLAERLTATAPISGPTKAAFFNAGAEAVENAVKIARVATGRPSIICFDRAFHGRTLLAMTLTSKVHPYKAGFGPFASDVYRAPYPYALEHGGDNELAGKLALEGLREMFTTHVAAETVAAIILEPVQGEGGFIVPPKSWMQGVRDICDEHGILMVIDEVQSGMGRTGKLWATNHYDGIEPDLLLTAKSIAMGMPLSGVIGKAKYMDAVPDSGMGGTYVGNPVAIAAALAVMDELEGGLIDRAAEVGTRLRAGFEAIAATEGANIGEVRGLGPMLAIEFGTPANPDKARANAVQAAALKAGLILLTAGTKGNVVRVLCPLVITDEQIDEALEILGDAVASTR